MSKIPGSISYSSDDTTQSISIGRLSIGGNNSKIFEYIEHRAWRKIYKLLTGRFAKEFCLERETSGLTVLSACIGFGAPFYILDQILKLEPDQYLKTDRYGATALHVACLNGQTYEIIEYLLNRCPSTAFVVDLEASRTPLHHITECLCMGEIDVISGKKVILKLFQINASAIFQPDKCGDTPIDIVQISRILRPEHEVYLLDLYVFMKELAIFLYKRNKLSWEEHSPYRHSVDSVSQSSRTYETSSSFPYQSSVEFNYDDIDMNE
jgi:ankyrin repeat protein